jgi:hypothetical protein
MTKHTQLVFPAEGSYNIDYNALYEDSPEEIKREMTQQRILHCKINHKYLCSGDSCGICGRF